MYEYMALEKMSRERILWPIRLGPEQRIRVHVYASR